MKKHQGYQPTEKVNTSNPPKGEVEFMDNMPLTEKILMQALLEKKVPIESIKSMSFSHHEYPLNIVERCIEIALKTKDFYCAGEKDEICLSQCKQCKKDQSAAAKIQSKL